MLLVISSPRENKEKIKVAVQGRIFLTLNVAVNLPLMVFLVACEGSGVEWRFQQRLARNR